jgi:polysaccharide export outer membrane protein
MKTIALFACVAFLAACTDGYTYFPVKGDTQQEKVVAEVKVVRLDATNIASFSNPESGPSATHLPGSGTWSYRLGAGDILAITVFDHPELATPSATSGNGGVSGFTVQADGRFYFPFIGEVTASNRSVQEVRSEIAQRLAEFIPEPQVEVRVAEYNSQRVLINGDVGSPNTQTLSVVPLTLLEAVNAAGGFNETADPRRITIQRRGSMYTVDMTGFLERGFRQNNPVLLKGDIVNVPPRRVLEAYLLGEISKRAPVDLSKEPVTLIQALTRQGGLIETRADARGIFVFRSGATGTTVYQLETSSPTGLLLGTKFVLEPGDVVYVTRSPLQRWNDTITSILPTVGAIKATNTLAN